MRLFDKQKLTEIVLFILNKTRGLDYYHLFKVIYFADAIHLSKYGIRMIEDDFCALPDGPVPSTLYDSVKWAFGGNGVQCDEELGRMIKASVTHGSGYDSYYFLTPLRAADADYLSKSEIECLELSISDNVELSYNDLRDKSHGEEWKRAYFCGSGMKVMDVIGIARDAHASDAMLDYIADQRAISEALR